MKNKTLLSFYMVLLALSSYAQGDTLRVLFLGNSYTNTNNLPQITQSLAAAAQKTLVTDKNTPGGHTLDEHSTNATSLTKIRQGQWDYVVLQEQSQVPTIDFYRYNLMYPAAQRLNDSIKKYNACAQVVFYMTWGRKLGGQQCGPGGTHCSPVFSNFNHMQDSLKSAYLAIADSTQAYLAPVGLAWQKVMSDTNLNLHTADNSHPNYSGSYLAACVFHATFWNESTLGLGFTGALSPGRAAYLQTAADSVVFPQYVQRNQAFTAVTANFSHRTFMDTVQFSNLSTYPQTATFLWDFGDGNTSTAENPQHVYAANQNYVVRLVVRSCREADILEQTVTVNSIGLEPTFFSPSIAAYPNPFSDYLQLSASNLAGPLKLRLMNYSGATVARFHLENTNDTRLNLKHLAPGLYLLQISDLNQQVVLRLRKN
jgi:hypothetical protein